MIKMSSLTMSSFFVMAITGEFGAGDIPLYLRIHGKDGNEGIRGIVLPGDATVQDLVDQEALSGNHKLTVAGKVLQRDETLADAGVSSECTIDVTTMSDIELLFNLFDDPAELKRYLNTQRMRNLRHVFPIKKGS